MEKIWCSLLLIFLIYDCLSHLEQDLHKHVSLTHFSLDSPPALYSQSHLQFHIQILPLCITPSSLPLTPKWYMAFLPQGGTYLISPQIEFCIKSHSLHFQMKALHSKTTKTLSEMGVVLRLICLHCLHSFGAGWLSLRQVPRLTSEVRRGTNAPKRWEWNCSGFFTFQMLADGWVWYILGIRLVLGFDCCSWTWCCPPLYNTGTV